MNTNRLRELRKKHSLTQAEMGKRLGYARQRYNFYETGKRQPDNDTLVKIAEILNTTTDYLLGTTNDPTLPSAKEKPPTNWELFEQEFIKAFGRKPTDSDIDKALLHLRVDAEFQKKNLD